MSGSLHKNILNDLMKLRVVDTILDFILTPNKNNHTPANCLAIRPNCQL